jgi:hypothetical protein
MRGNLSPQREAAVRYIGGKLAEADAAVQMSAATKERPMVFTLFGFGWVLWRGGKANAGYAFDLDGVKGALKGTEAQQSNVVDAWAALRAAVIGKEGLRVTGHHVREGAAGE